MDQQFAKAFRSFDEPLWTPCETLRWVLERKRAAVEGHSIEDDERVPQAVCEIQQALAAGEVRAFGHTFSDPVMRELPSETWSVDQLAIELRDGLLFIVPIRLSGSEECVLQDVQLRREDVLRRWPDDSSPGPRRESTTAASESSALVWLTDLMKANRDKPRAKALVREEAMERYPKLSKNGFDRAWSHAVTRAAAENWSAPGRRS